MRQLYEQIQVDKEKMRFYAECNACGKRQYAGKVPFPCRGEELLQLLEEGYVGGLRQRIYNRSKAQAVQDLARHFNQCRVCGKWVCDEMYDSNALKCKHCEGGM